MATTTDAPVGGGEALSVRGITVRFGGVVANNNITLRAEPGRITALIGPNGAGKTTFINAVTGFVRAQGEVEIGGRPLHGTPPHERRRLGLARTWQAGELFDSLSVLDNVRVAEEHAGASWLVKDFFPPSSEGERRARHVLGLVGLTDDLDGYPGELSLGHQRLVGVARALAGDPHVLLLDEPAAGLDSDESLALGAQLQTIAASGTSILLVDHDMSLVFGVAQYVYVLDFGELIAEGEPAAVQANPIVIDAYLGASVAGEGEL
jgi:branched-chain amino acid transport system ATP-binding protein